jgi:prophage antirepressor-like protein
MSGEVLIIEGIESKDGWLDFDQLHALLHTYKITSKHDGQDFISRSNAKSCDWYYDQIKPKYKKLGSVKLLSGATINRRWVNEHGAYQFALMCNTPNAEPFQELVLEKIIPQVRRTGSFVPELTGNNLADFALNLSEQAKIVARSILESAEAKRVADKAAQDAHEASIGVADCRTRLDDAVQRLDEITGDKVLMTAMLFLKKSGVNPQAIYPRTRDTNAKVLGGWCTRESRRRGLPLPEKIAMGGFDVNQYEPALLSEGVKALGMIQDQNRATDPACSQFRWKLPTNTAEWHRLVDGLKITGIAAQLARHCNLVALSDGHLTLQLDPAAEDLRTPTIEERLRSSVAAALNEPALRLEVRVVRLDNDVVVKRLREQFGAAVVPGSVQICP